MGKSNQQTFIIGLLFAAFAYSQPIEVTTFGEYTKYSISSGQYLFFSVDMSLPGFTGTENFVVGAYPTTTSIGDPDIYMSTVLEII